METRGTKDLGCEDDNVEGVRGGGNKIGEQVSKICPVVVGVVVDQREDEHAGGARKVGCVAGDEDGDQADQYLDRRSIPDNTRIRPFFGMCPVIFYGCRL